jgi:hypothetical protein
VHNYSIVINSYTYMYICPYACMHACTTMLPSQIRIYTFQNHWSFYAYLKYTYFKTIEAIILNFEFMQVWVLICVSPVWVWVCYRLRVFCLSLSLLSSAYLLLSESEYIIVCISPVWVWVYYCLHISCLSLSLLLCAYVLSESESIIVCICPVWVWAMDINGCTVLVHMSCLSLSHESHMSCLSLSLSLSHGYIWVYRAWHVYRWHV